MIRKVSMLGLAIGLAVIGLALFVSLIAVADSVGTAFTYQGYLEDGGIAANGDYDFKFDLYDAASGGNLEDTQTITPVTVSDGLFTVELDFGSDDFTGDARWLEISVRQGADSYTKITPRTALTPAPYALHAVDAWAITGNSGTTYGTNFLGTTDEVSLTLAVSNTAALRLEPHATSPNVIGGYSGNGVTAGVVGATIGGGGYSSNPNSVTDDYGTVGGGYRNRAGDDTGTTSDAPSATVGGGGGNTASGDYATVGGGFRNTAGGQSATVGGGGGNSASQQYATVGGGYDNEASGDYATVGGGGGNSASQQSATVGGGHTNQASGDYATVGGGHTNQASGDYATVGGGAYNTASDYYATVPGGYQAEASLYGQMAYASGKFSTAGDAQASLYVLRKATSNADPTELYLDGSSRRLTVASGRSITFDILVVARSDGGDSAGYRVEGVIENVSTNTSFIGTPTVTELGEDSDWTVDVEADDTNDALVIKVTGADSTNIRWVATVRTAEVAY